MPHPPLPPGDPRHGTPNGYVNLHCHCARCQRAHTEAKQLQQAARVGSLAADDPRHGKVSSYDNYGCRCVKCDAAKRRSRRAYR